MASTINFLEYPQIKSILENKFKQIKTMLGTSSNVLEFLHLYCPPPNYYLKFTGDCL